MKLIDIFEQSEYNTSGTIIDLNNKNIKDRFKRIFKIGDICGNFTILDNVSIKKKNAHYYKIRCKCGNILYKELWELKARKNRHCKKII